MSATCNRKRKIHAEQRKFKQEWTTEYAFIKSNEKYICLICQDSIAMPKEYNFKRHQEMKHGYYSKFSAIEKEHHISKLQKSLTSQQMYLLVVSFSEIIPIIKLTYAKRQN